MRGLEATKKGESLRDVSRQILAPGCTVQRQPLPPVLSSHHAGAERRTRTTRDTGQGCMPGLPRGLRVSRLCVCHQGAIRHLGRFDRGRAETRAGSKLTIQTTSAPEVGSSTVASLLLDAGSADDAGLPVEVCLGSMIHDPGSCWFHDPGSILLFVLSDCSSVSGSSRDSRFVQPLEEGD